MHPHLEKLLSDHPDLPIKEMFEIMSQLSGSLATALQAVENLAAQSKTQAETIVKQAAQIDAMQTVAAAGGADDPADDATVQQIIDTATGAVTPPAAPASAPVTTTTNVFAFTGTDPSTIDAAAWPVAVVQTDTGQVLFNWAGAGAAPVGAEWTPYTGPTQPVAPQAAPVAPAVPDALAVTQVDASLPVNTPANFPVAVSGGTPPYVFTMVGLPDGLEVDGSGQITGTPTTAGAFPVSVGVTDSAGISESGAFTITIA